jgi:hypothetical protein
MLSVERNVAMRSAQILLTNLSPMSAFAVDDVPPKIKDVQIYDKSLTPEQIKTALAGQSPMNLQK